MIEALDIKPTNDTPKVILDAENELFEISGRSLPEDVVTFYDPIISWLDEYAKSPKEETEFVFKYTYFNTATSKIILDILYKLEELHGKATQVQVIWFYEEDDEDMLDQGEEFAENVDVPFDILSY